jgi:hypothetical protein
VREIHCASENTERQEAKEPSLKNKDGNHGGRAFRT